MRRLLSASVSLLVVFASCGDGSATETQPTDASGETAPDTQASDTALTTLTGSGSKPKVQIPAQLPTKLVITVLKEGSGEPAKIGDTVEVNYVGVRSVDGTEFDNSYDRGQTFPVQLGSQSVIQGWEDGLLGAKAGSQIQLDIPSALAYGDQDKGIIKPGDALTFVIDVVSVTVGVPPPPTIAVPTANPADEPTVSIPTSNGAAELIIEDIKVGTGAEAVEGATGYIQIIGYNGATAEVLQSTWKDGGQAVEIPIDASQSVLPGLIAGVTGMKVGGQRLLIIPFKDAWGAVGNPGFGLPASTDLIAVVELVAVAPAP